MSKDSESKSRDVSRSKKPLVIYISENDHSDMSYGSVTAKIIKDCQNKGLAVQSFSEFESQSQKVGWMKRFLKNQGEEGSFKATTNFLDKEFIPMLPFTKRFGVEEDVLQGVLGEEYVDALKFKDFLKEKNKIKPNPEAVIAQDDVIMLLNKFRDDPKVMQQLEGLIKHGNNINNFVNNAWPKELTPSRAFDDLLEEVDNPDIKVMLKKYQENWIVDDGDKGKKGVNKLRNCFSYNQIHEAMANNIEGMLQPETDVVIVVAGSQHVFGLNKNLGAFEGCEKIVVGNIPENLSTLKETLVRDGIETKDGRAALEEIFSHGGTPESCAQVARCVNFEVDSKSKEASIPDTVRTSIDKRSIKNTKEKSVLEEKTGLSPSIKDELRGIAQESREIHARFNDGPTHDRVLHTMQKKPGKSWVDRVSEQREGRGKESDNGGRV